MNSIKGVKIPLIRRAEIVLIEGVEVNRGVVQEIRNLDREGWRGLEVGLRTGQAHDLEVDPLAKRVPGHIVAAKVDLWRKVVDAVEMKDMMGNTVWFTRTAKPGVEIVIYSIARNGVIKRKEEKWKQTWLRSQLLRLMLWRAI